MGLPLFGISKEEFKLDPAVAAPYLKTLESAKPFDRLYALLRRENIASDMERLNSSLLDTAYTLEGYARRCEQGGEAALLSKDVVDEKCRDILATYPGLIETVEKKISTTNPTDPKYTDYLELHSVLCAMHNAIDRSAVAQNIRTIRSQTAKAEDLEPELLAFRDAVSPLADRLDDEPYAMENESLAPHEKAQAEVLRMIDQKLSAFSQTEDWENLSADYSAHSAEADKAIPDILKSHFADAADLKTMHDMTVNLIDFKDQLDEDKYRFCSNLRDRAAAYLEEMGFSGVKSAFPVPNSLAEALIEEGTADEKRTALRRGFGAAIPDEACDAIIQFYRDNSRQYQELDAQQKKLETAINGLPAFWEKAGFDFLKKALLSQHAAEFMERRENALASVSDSVSGTERASLKFLADQLGRTSKIGWNSGEYNDFRRSLKEAIKGGSMEKLIQDTRKYVTEKEKDGGPSSDNGKHRLNIAKQVLTLAQSINAHRAVPEAKATKLDPFDVSYDTPHVVDNLPPVQKQEPFAQGMADLRLGDPVAHNTSDLKPSQGIPGTEPRNDFAIDPFNEPSGNPVAHNTSYLKPSQDYARYVPLDKLVNDPSVPINELGGDLPYLSWGDPVRSMDHDENHPALIFANIFTESGKDWPRASQIMSKAMQIMHNNLTGDIDRDLKSAYMQFREAFLLPKDGQPPLIPGYEELGQKPVSFTYITDQMAEYDNFAKKKMADIPAEGLTSRMRMEQAQIAEVEKKFSHLSPEKRSVIHSIVTDPSCNARMKNAMLELDYQTVDELSNPSDNAAQFKQKLAGAVKSKFSAFDAAAKKLQARMWEFTVDDSSPTPKRFQIERKQLFDVEWKYQDLHEKGVLSPETCQSVLEIARDPNCSMQARQFLLELKPETLQKTMAGCRNNVMEFKKQLSTAISRIDQTAEQKQSVQQQANKTAQKDGAAQNGPKLNP